MNENLELNAKVIYLLMIVNIIIQFLGVIGVILAYTYRKEAPDWLKTHFDFQIRTFWVGLVLMLLGGFFYYKEVGSFVLIFWIVWVLIRCIKGVRVLIKREPYPNPTSWMV
jgi:uncharacterized membrane protein